MSGFVSSFVPSETLVVIIGKPSTTYNGWLLAEIEEIHRAIIRVERAITDKLLFIAEARDVVPMPPLGLLHGLDYPYVSAASIQDMLKHWDRLSDERNKWPSQKSI